MGDYGRGLDKLPNVFGALVIGGLLIGLSAFVSEGYKENKAKETKIDLPKLRDSINKLECTNEFDCSLKVEKLLRECKKINWDYQKIVGITG